MKYLLDIDSKLPNLALMRLSTYWKARGESVKLVTAPHRKDLWDVPGEVYGSSIFKFSEKLRQRAEREWGAITWGGTGVRIESSLAEIDGTIDWETVELDYSIYPTRTERGEIVVEDRSFGFTQRGCRLKCKFCVVPKKEGAPRSVHTIGEIWRGGKHPKKIVLLDNDFFGQSDWRLRIAELVAGDFRVCFSQGINIRLIDAEAAAALATIEYRDNAFERRRLYTAWDSLGEEKAFKDGVEQLRAAGVPPTHLRVYMLTGFAKRETMEDVLYRFDEMVKLGCEPYPMVYDEAESYELLKKFQRFVVTGMYRAIKWEDYDTRIRNPKKPKRFLPVVQ